MIANNKQKILLGIPLVLVLGMGSYWFVLRDTGPKTEQVVNAGPVQKQVRHAGGEKIDKPVRGNRTGEIPRQEPVEKKVRKRAEQKQHVKEKRGHKHQEIKKKDKEEPNRG